MTVNILTLRKVGSGGMAWGVGYLVGYMLLSSFVVLMPSGNCNTSCLELCCATVVIHHIVISQLR